jgi:phospholipid/cholesterol/gamma-HCH transport system substrate-binding protein
METKSNYVMVGAITLLLLALVAAFIIWLSRAGEGDRKEYDFFSSSR